MSNVWKSMQLDYHILKANYKMFALAFVPAIILGAFRQPVFVVLIAMAIAAVFSGTYFAVYEKNNLNKLYGTLPMGKSDVVIGRYLYALCFGAAIEIVSGSLAYIISFLVKQGIDRVTLITFSSASFLYFCLFVGISFPVYFRYGFSKAYIFTALPLYIVLAGGMLIMRKGNALQTLSQIVNYFTSHQNMIWITGVGLGLILLAISCSVSYFISRNNEL